MTGLDTNVLVRFLVRDDEDQHQRAIRLLSRGPDEGVVFFVPDVVLAELAWVLQGSYELGRRQIHGALRALAEAAHLEFESADRLLRALRRYETGRAGFADYLLAERARDAGCAVVATFDGDLQREAGFEAP